MRRLFIFIFLCSLEAHAMPAEKIEGTWDTSECIDQRTGYSTSRPAELPGYGPFVLQARSNASSVVELSYVVSGGRPTIVFSNIDGPGFTREINRALYYYKTISSSYQIKYETGKCSLNGTNCSLSEFTALNAYEDGTLQFMASENEGGFHYVICRLERVSQ